MADITITLKSNIPQLIQQLAGAVEASQKEQARQVQALAQHTCPVVTGHLRDSAFNTTEATTTIITSEVGFTAPYAPIVESRKHYLRDAYMNKEQSIVADVGDKIDKLVGRVANV